jgi:hypothetical protein
MDIEAIYSFKTLLKKHVLTNAEPGINCQRPRALNSMFRKDNC